MGMNMKTKFEKYWGDLEKINFLIFFANILDPSLKLSYMEFSLSQLYGEVKGGSIFSVVKYALYELYNDYVTVFKSGSTSKNQSQFSLLVESSQSDSVGGQTIGKPMSVLKAKFKKHKMETGVG